MHNNLGINDDEGSLSYLVLSVAYNCLLPTDRREVEDAKYRTQAACT